jgi:hypothetical protein
METNKSYQFVDTNKSYKHSGTLGDLIYSLSILEKLGAGDYNVLLNNIEHCVAQYGYRPDEVDPAHKGRLTQTDFDLLKPLLEYQPYIKKVSAETRHTVNPNSVDLDKFRGVLFRGFEGNYVQAYHMTFGLPFVPDDLLTTWLRAEHQREAPIVVSRTFRYRCPKGDAQWAHLSHVLDVGNNGVFLGSEDEWKDFVKVTGTQIRHKPVKDFLEMASIINAADTFLGNQNFAFSLAMGLGVPAVLETIKIKPLYQNECYFPRPNIRYF